MIPPTRLTAAAYATDPATLSVAHMKPRQTFLGEYVPRRLKLGGSIKCADMEMRFSRQGLAFAGQRRPAPGAKSPPSTGRRIELGYLTFGNGIRSAIECHEDGNGRSAMLPTTLAMTPRHPFRLAGSDEAHRAAEAATFELFGRAAHNLILSTSSWVSRSFVLS